MVNLSDCSPDYQHRWRSRQQFWSRVEDGAVAATAIASLIFLYAPQLSPQRKALDMVSYHQEFVATTTSSVLVSNAQKWVGKEFNPGESAQCAYFVRAVLEESGVTIGVTQQPYDGYTTSEGYANSFFGKDIGLLIYNASDLRAGDLIAFSNTYGDWPDGTITHGGIYIGDGMMIDRPTASEPVQKSAIADFDFAVGVRLGARLGAPARSEDSPQNPDFDKSVAFIFEWEGGLSDHPNDHGGRTNMGITEDRAAAHGLTPDEVTKEKATEIYRTDYWDTAGCGGFEYPLSMACLNTAVNSGVAKAKEFNALIGDGSARDEAIAYAQRQEDYYRDIVSRRPDQEVFLQGWLNRSNALKKQLRR